MKSIVLIFIGAFTVLAGLFLYIFSTIVFIDYSEIGGILCYLGTAALFSLGRLINQKEEIWKNLAPNLCRQRIIIEATVENFIEDPTVIADYLRKLTEVVGMVPCREPIVYTAHEDGWGAWQHWKTSGATFYSYPSRNGDPALITLDCYTCKPFVTEKAVMFTENYFKTKEIVWKEI